MELLKPKPKKAVPKKVDSKAVVEQEPVHQEPNEPRTAVSAPKKLNVLGLIALMVAVGGLALSGMVYNQHHSLVKELKTTQTQLQKIVSLQEKEHAVDLFARYFLPNYYSGDGNKVTAYLGKSLSKDTIPLPSGQLQSAVLETIAEEGDVFKLIYVVAVKTDQSSKSQRLTFEVKEDKKSDYGFSITKLPKATAYP